MKTNLCDIGIGQRVLITAVGGTGRLRQHFLDMGVIPGTVVQLVKYAPMGDPMILELHGYMLSLCKADAAQIEVTYDVPDEAQARHRVLDGRTLDSVKRASASMMLAKLRQWLATRC